MATSLDNDPAPSGVHERDDPTILSPPFPKGGQGGFYNATGDPSPNAASTQLFFRFMTDLDGAIRDQDLKAAQIRELTNKMLDDVGNLIPKASEAGNSAAVGGQGAPGQARSPNSSISESLNSPDTNTSRNINAGTNVVESYRKRVGTDKAGQAETLGYEQNPWAWVGGTPPWLRQTPDLKVITEVPSDAVPHLAPDGQTFFPAPDAEFHKVYEAGKANGLEPIAASQAIGQFGRFDFQRQESEKRFIRKYTNAPNFAVGVYMRAAGFSLEETKFIA
jgi:hypothetical protein